MDKLVLEPVKVPWKISSADEINLFQSADYSIRLTLMASIINESSKSERSWEQGADVFDAIDDVELCLEFDGVIYFDFIRPRQAVFGLDPQRYDFHLIGHSSELNFFKKWFSDQCSPDPKMYQIPNSDIKRKMNISGDSMRHWLLTGHEEIVNVVADSFRWSVVQRFHTDLDAESHAP